MANRKYYHGEVVGTYTVIEYKSDGKILCKCNKCGSKHEVRSSNIRRNSMCRDCRARFNTRPKSNLVGEKFGRLTVVRYFINSKGHIEWECLCECGRTAIVPTNRLKSGHTKSCGCYMVDRIREANKIDLTGQRFGKLVVKEQIEGHIVPSGQMLSNYLCVCDCGSEVSVLAMNLRSGNTQSCGCIGSSIGEFTVQEILVCKNIRFTKQHTFNDLRSKTGGGLLKFDFAIWDDNDYLICLLEYNGEQHYYTDPYKTNFGKMQREETDQIKREYCKEKGIKLYEFRYDENLNDAIEKMIFECKIKEDLR